MKTIGLSFFYDGHRLLAFTLILLFLFNVLFPVNSLQSIKLPHFSAVNPSQLLESYGKMPLIFEANNGQTDAQVRFLSHGNGYTLFLTPTEAVVSLKDNIIRMQLVGANPFSELLGQDELSGKANYFIGNDPKNWKTNIETYKKVRYASIYQGIDVIFYGNQGQLEYDFIIKPGADPGLIALSFSGMQGLKLTDGGSLVLTTEKEELVLKKPVLYQMINGERRGVAGDFFENQDKTIGFSIGSYDSNYELVIDPILEYSTYLGGSSDDGSTGIAVDNNGNMYISGVTSSVNFPTANAIQSSSGSANDAFVTKLDPTGSTIIYSTYFGGSNSDIASGVVIDPSGNAHVSGLTNSLNFPTENPFQAIFGGGSNDAFLLKLNATGSALLYATYLGGSNFDSGEDINIDSSGNAYITGITRSSDFPLANPIQPTLAGSEDVFVSKIDSGGSALTYSTFIGGSGQDHPNNLAIDSSGAVYITGQTYSANFPIVNAYQDTYGGGGNQDAFVVKINPAGSAFDYSTYLGGSNIDLGHDIAVDTTGNAYVSGQTYSTNFPIVNAIQPSLASTGNEPDAFVTKFNSAGSALIYSTYFGGGDADIGSSIALDSLNNVYFVGSTRSVNFPMERPVQATYSGGGAMDVFVTKLNDSASGVIYSTYLGGTNQDEATAITVDQSNIGYITGVTGSSNFPTVTPFQATNAGLTDVFLVKISDDPPPTPTPSPSPTPTPLPSPVILTPQADSYIKQGGQNQNEGASSFLRLQSSGHNRALIKFDQSQVQTAVGNAQSFTAKLQLTISDNADNWGPLGRTIGLHRLTYNWLEGNGFISGNHPPSRGSGSGATWNCAIDSNISNFNDDCSGIATWDMSNSSLWPFISAATDTNTITNNQTGIVEFNVTSDIQSFTNNSNQNYGWLVKKTNEGANGQVSFGSKESSNSPKLIITFQ